MASDSKEDQLLEGRASTSVIVEACESAEAFGGGSEHSPFWRLPLWPFTSTRFCKEEE